MKRTVQILSACILVLLAGATPTAADCKPVVGHFEATLVPPGVGHCPPDPSAFCTAGRVWGGIQGNYQFFMTGALPSSAIAGGQGGFASLITFGPGSQIRLRGEFDPAAASTSGDYNGNMCTP